MKYLVSRRAALASALMLPALKAGYAAEWPLRTIRIVVPYAPGGSVDTTARLVAAVMGSQLKQPVVVENRPGATGTVGAGEVARSAADGYTLLVDAAAHAANPALFPNLPFRYEDAFAPISRLTISPLMLVVHPSVPARSVAEFLALAKAKPGSLSYGTPGNASAAHLAASSMAKSAGIDIVHVAYRGGGPATQDLLAGTVQFSFATVSTAVPLVKENRLRALAVTTPERIAPLPDLPTMSQSGFPGFGISEWAGFYAPAGTDPAIVARLGEASRQALQDPMVRQRLEQIGSIAVGSTPEEFSPWLRNQRNAMAALIRDTGIRVE